MAERIVIKSDKPGMLRINGGLEEVDMPPIDGGMPEFVEESLPSNFREIWEMEGQSTSLTS